MSAYQIANLITRHEADPTTWVQAVFGSNAQVTTQQMIEVQQGIDLSSPGDRYETARRLRASLNTYQIRETAYQQVYGASADPYRVEGFRQGQEFLTALIEALEV